MRSRAGTRAQALLAVAVLALGLVGVPALLVWRGWEPWPDTIPSFARMRVALQQGDIPAAAVIQVLATTVWLIWLQFAWATAWELAVNLRRGDRGRRPITPPLVPASMSAGIGRLVALAISVGSITLPTANFAAALPAIPMSITSTGHAITSTTTNSEPTALLPAASRPCWLVQRGDTLWKIATDALGDGSRAGEILELNSTIHSPRQIFPGQLIQLPNDATVPDDRQPPASPPTQRESIQYLAAADIVVVSGDTLWDLSAHRLETATGWPPTPPEIVTYLAEVTAANAAVADNPDLIFPGQQLHLPAIGTPPTSPPEPTPPPDPTTMPVEPAPPATSPESERVPSPPNTPATTPPDPALAPPAPVTTTPTTAPSTTIPPTEPSRTTAAANSAPLTMARAADASDSREPWLAGITGATVLSSVLLVAYRRRRHRQTVRGAAAYRQQPQQPDTLDALVAAADVGLVRWAAHAIADLCEGLQPPDVIGVPLAVELSETDGIELLWSHRNTTAPFPWIASDGGWSWRLAYDPDTPIPVHPRPPPMPALVTIGTRDGNQLLLNLEAFGSVAITGDPTAAENLARSIVVELAANDLTSDTYIIPLGFPTDVGGGFDRIIHHDPADAVNYVRGVTNGNAEVLHRANLETTFALRLGGDAHGREVALVTARESCIEDLDQLLAVSSPNRGGVTLLLGDHEAAYGATIEVHSDGTAHIDQLDLDVTATQLPSETVQQVSELLHEATVEPAAVDAPAPIPLDDRTNAVDDDLAFFDADNQVAVTSEERVDGTPHPLVRVLGNPTVEGVDGLGRIETNIVTYLACRNGRATKDQLVHAVWGGRLISDSTVFNRIAKTRAALGDYLPTRTKSSTLIHLDQRITTDITQIRTAIAGSSTMSSHEALDTLVAALELVRGVPFDADGYDWAHEQQHVADAAEAVETATLRAVGLALECDDIRSARRAIALGLRALPGNEPIYRARMQTEHAAGNTDGVQAAFAELRHFLDCTAADPDDFAPSAETIQIHRQLTASLHT